MINPPSNRPIFHVLVNNYRLWVTQFLKLGYGHVVKRIVNNYLRQTQVFQVFWGRTATTRRTFSPQLAQFRDEMSDVVPGRVCLPRLSSQRRLVTKPTP